MEKKIAIDRERCKGCELCVAVCPKQVLALDMHAMNQKGYHPSVQVRPKDCIFCGMCTVVCPDLAILLLEEEAKSE